MTWGDPGGGVHAAGVRLAWVITGGPLLLDHYGLTVTA